MVSHVVYMYATIGKKYITQGVTKSTGMSTYQILTTCNKKGINKQTLCLLKEYILQFKSLQKCFILKEQIPLLP